MKFSGVWTVVIIAQVAITVAFPSIAFYVLRETARIQSVDIGFEADQYVSVRLEPDAENASGLHGNASRADLSAHFRRTYRELERRLSAAPGVGGVTFADRLPGMYHWTRQIDRIEGEPARGDSVLERRVNTAYIDADYFDVLGAPIVQGRGFNAADIESGHRVVIANQSFVYQVLQGRNAIGRRVRFQESGGSDQSSPKRVRGTRSSAWPVTSE